MNRGAVIGCGFFAQNHLHAWQMIPSAKIVAVCDINEARAKEYAERFGIARYYSDCKAMLEQENLDFVDIVTQGNTHAALTQLVASYGVNMICQKPLAPSFEEAKQIVATCQNVQLMVHENFRWQRPMLELKKAADSLGELFFGRISFRSAYDIYAVQPYLATDERFIIYDLGVHLFDLARFYFGEATSLICHTQRINPKIVAEDVATALLKMNSGAHVIVDMSYASRLEHESFPQTFVDLEGSKGSARLDRNFQLSVSTNAGTELYDVSPRSFDWSSGFINAVPEGVLNIQRHFIECLEAGRSPATSGSDNLKTLELSFAAYTSAAEAKSITFRGQS